MQAEPTPAAAAAGGTASVADRDEPTRTPRGRRRPRWRAWLVVALVLVGLRLTLPAVVAPQIAARLSRALGTRVEVGDVSFAPIDAIITLRYVTVHAPAGSAAPADTPPPIVAKRVRVDLQWLPLMHRQLHVRELALESGSVAFDRFADGGFGLANLERADPASELPPGWSFLLDRIAFRDARIRVRDLAAGGTALVEATLRDAAISGLRRRPTAFGRAHNLRVDAFVGGGRMRVHGRYELRDDGLVLDALMRLKDVALAPMQPYVADLGWTALAGHLSGRLRWQRDPRRRDLLSGRAILRHTRVQVAGVAEPALEIRRGVAEIAAIDLLARRITVRSMILHRPTLALRPDADRPIPLLRTALPIHPATRAGAGGTARSAASPWSWMIERFDTTYGRVRVLAPDGPLTLQAQVTGENLGPGAYWSPLRIELARRGTAAAFDGTLRFTGGVTVEGRLAAAGIDLPVFAKAVALPWADFVQAGRATADLNVQLDWAARDDPPFFARGEIGLTDVWIAGWDPGSFGIGSTAIDLTLAGFTPAEAPRADGRGGRPTQITFSHATFTEPFVLLTRTGDGWVPPALTAPADIDSLHAAATPNPSLAAAAMPRMEVVIGDARSSRGKLMVVDLVPAAPVTWSIAGIEGSLQRLALPTFSYDGMRLRGSDPRFGRLQLSGTRRAGVTDFELIGDGVPLAAATPYLRLAGLPYSFASGIGFITARGTVQDGHWSAFAALTLQNSSLVGAEALQVALGMPLTSALAVLRDENQEIQLQLALASPRSGKRVPYAEQVATGIRDSMRSATETALIASREGAAALPIVDIPFPPGRAHLTALAAQDVAPLAQILGTRPGLVAEVTAATSSTDRRWLAEQALRRRLDDGGGFMGILRAFGMQDARARIRVALEARAHGGRGFLDPDDEALLTRLLAEAPPIHDGQLLALGEARVLRVSTHLADHYGIYGRRVIVRRAGLRDGGDFSGVRLRLAVGADPSARPLVSTE